jgi:Mg/Co/Ni transporter MgtE
MDGGRVFRAVLANRHGDLWATRVATGVAQALGVAMIVFGVLGDLWLVLIGLFVLLGATSERRSASVRAALQGVRVGDLMTFEATSVPAQVNVHELGSWLSMFPGRALPVIDGTTCIGVVAMEDLLGAQPWTPVGAVCDRDAPILEATIPAFPQAVDAFMATRRQQLAVTYAGRPVGVLYRTTLASAAVRPVATPGRVDERGGYRAA